MRYQSTPGRGFSLCRPELGGQSGGEGEQREQAGRGAGDGLVGPLALGLDAETGTGLSTHLKWPKSSLERLTKLAAGCCFRAPFAWLAAGVADFRRSLGSSLLAGGASVLASWLVIGLLLWLELNFLLLPMITGFMLVSPLLAVGFYENARRLEAGEAPRAGAAIAAFRRDGFGLAVVGGALLLALYGWLRVTKLVIGLFVLALVLAMVVPDGDAGLDPDMRTLVILLELVVRMGGLGIALGAILAAAVFGLAAISLPMLVERRMNPLRAVWISLRAVTANAAPAALWAVLTTGLTLLAMLPGFLGFTLAMPVLGYATWHAYRAMVEASTLAATASGA